MVGAKPDGKPVGKERLNHLDRCPVVRRAILGHDDRLTARLDRQQLLTRQDSPLHVTAVIDESVLMRQIGGPAVLLEQLHHLARMSYRPNIELRILPFDAAGHPMAAGAAMIFDIGHNQVVYLEHVTGGHYLDRRDDVEGHLDAFDKLASVALSEEESLARLHERAKEIA
jgi:hypothetical protein